MAWRSYLRGRRRASLRRVSPSRSLARSAQLEAGGTFDGVEQLASQERLVLELGELQQVHAGAGRGQPLQVGAAVVDAEGGVQLLEDSGSQLALSRRLHTERTTQPKRQRRTAARRRHTDKQGPAGRAGNPGTWTQSHRPALTGHLGPSQAGQAAPAEATSAACGFPGVVNGTHVPRRGQTEREHSPGSLRQGDSRASYRWPSHLLYRCTELHADDTRGRRYGLKPSPLFCL